MVLNSDRREGVGCYLPARGVGKVEGRRDALEPWQNAPLLQEEPRVVDRGGRDPRIRSCLREGRAHGLGAAAHREASRKQN